MSRVVEAVLTFDGRDRGALEAVLGMPWSPADAAWVVDRCGDDDVGQARAAAWLVRKTWERKIHRSLDMARAFAGLVDPAHWTVLFDLLTCVQFAPHDAQAYLPQVKVLLDDARTAVRVAALDALVQLALVDPKLRPEAEARLVLGSADDKASIRARTRQLQARLAKA